MAYFAKQVSGEIGRKLLTTSANTSTCVMNGRAPGETRFGLSKVPIWHFFKRVFEYLFAGCQRKKRLWKPP